MRKWLKTKEEEQKKIFKDLMDMSYKEIKKLNKSTNNGEIAVRVIFKKDEWLNGKVNLEVLKKNKEGEYVLKEEYTHSIYDQESDMLKKSEIYKLMKSGLFNNCYFFILDSVRAYDVDILLTNSGYVLENEDCEHREKVYQETHSGFNVTNHEMDEINVGDYVDVKGFKDVACVCIGKENDFIRFRYEATRQVDKKIIWVESAEKMDFVKFLKEPDDNSMHVVNMTGPYGESKKKKNLK